MHKAENQPAGFSRACECCKPLSWHRSLCARSLCGAPAFALRPPPFSSSHPSRPSIAAPPYGIARPWVAAKMYRCVSVHTKHIPGTRYRAHSAVHVFCGCALVLCAMFCFVRATSRETKMYHGLPVHEIFKSLREIKHGLHACLSVHTKHER